MNASASYPPDVVRTTLWIIRELTQLKDQRFVDGVRIRSLVDQLGLPEIEQKIYFLRELHAVTSILCSLANCRSKASKSS